MESIVTTPTIVNIAGFINTSKLDPKAEIECKLLAGKIQTKDVVDRILNTISKLSIGLTQETTRMTFSYPDSTRVSVDGVSNIHAIGVSNSFKGILVNVEKKSRYSGVPQNVIDIPEIDLRFTLNSENPLGKDWFGNPNDPKAFIRLLNRKSFRTEDELFQIDFSIVKTRPSGSRKTIKDLLKEEHTYELEIEFIKKDSTLPNQEIVKKLLKIYDSILQSYHETHFVLPNSMIVRYQNEFRLTDNKFYNPVTMMRRHISPRNPHNILRDYTVTNKADGQRSGLYVSRDRRVLKITPTEKVTWTGITANSDDHLGDFLDGEYLADKNLFCIFDVYRFRKVDRKQLPLMTSEEDLVINPEKSRLGCAKLFIEDLKTKFTIESSSEPMRIETKLFMSGDGEEMEKSIKFIMSQDFGYETDGLIFTPKSSPVAPDNERKKNTWLRVYKWKPANQNSIDFLVKISSEETFDPILKTKAKKGSLYISKSAGDDIVYPRETLNGEYIPPKVDASLDSKRQTNTIPAIFQPNVPRDPDAYQILVPVNEKGVTVDKYGQKVEDNTIIECVFDVETRRWTILRTRYDKTYQYRVLKKPQYGNNIETANSNWTSIHVPITEEMIQNFVSNPPDDTYEDDMYYRDDLKRTSRAFKDVYDFHNRVKDKLYKENINPTEDILLELASGRAGDLHKWKATKVKKVVAMDISLANIISPAQGAAVRYLKDKKDHPSDYRPPVLFLQGDMSIYPLFDQEDKYMPIVKGEQKAPTEYLEQFYDIKEFDVISCQFAMHYACETEETFQAFAKNLEKYGKGLFFGTCLDGQAVYSLLMGKKTHLFTSSEGQVAGEITKEYLDKDSWTDEFGMAIKVYLESFEKPEIEYLVPFEKVVDVLREHGYELVETKMFSEVYSNQTQITLTQTEQSFSFLNRYFVFKRAPKPEVKEPLPETEIIEIPKEEEKTKTKKLKKKEEEPEPILFFGADESKGEYRNFSNMSEHPIEVDGEKFPTVEHYVQAMKAKEFKDDEIYNKIIKAKTPKAVKAMGQKVKNFIKEVWDEKRDKIVRIGVKAKFTQHPELRKQLQETGEKIIGEADPRDTYWGIGTGMETDKAKKPSKWRGQNKMGKLLMELRTEFTFQQ